jgi:DNA-binding NarL/FixJ family response regulator
METTAQNEAFKAIYTRLLLAIKRKVWGTARDRDELIQNALCWAMEILPDVMQAHADLDTIIAETARLACNRRRTWGTESQGDYKMDALYHAVGFDPNNEDDSPIDHEGEDCTAIGWRLADLPPALADIAVLLSKGLCRVTIATILGVSPATITRRCVELEREINHLRQES